MKASFEFKRVYGRVKFYPLDKPAMAFCKLSERVCLSPTEIIELLKLMNFGLNIEIMEKITDGEELVKVNNKKIAKILGL